MINIISELLVPAVPALRAGGGGRVKPNEPKRLKMLVINKIDHEAEKQTHARYQPCYQSLTAIFGPILKQFVWIASCPIADSGLWPNAGRRPNLRGLTTKAAMSFRMNRMAFNTARYRGLGCSERGRRSPLGFRGRQAKRCFTRLPRRSSRTIAVLDFLRPFQAPKDLSSKVWNSSGVGRRT